MYIIIISDGAKAPKHTHHALTGLQSYPSRMHQNSDQVLTLAKD